MGQLEEDEELLDSCPNCDAQWGIEEISFQECDSCGYPDCEDDFDEFGDYEEEQFDKEDDHIGI